MRGRGFLKGGRELCVGHGFLGGEASVHAAVPVAIAARGDGLEVVVGVVGVALLLDAQLEEGVFEGFGAHPTQQHVRRRLGQQHAPPHQPDAVRLPGLLDVVRRYYHRGSLVGR